MVIRHRVAELGDLAILLELVREFHLFEKLEFDPVLDGKVLQQFLTDQSLGLVWFIEANNEVIGYLMLTLGFSLEYRGRDAFIDEFYLRSQYRGQGIGTQTLAYAEAICRELGVQALHLEVDFDNFDAQRLYHRVGYERHHRFLMTQYLGDPG